MRSGQLLAHALSLVSHHNRGTWQRKKRQHGVYIYTLATKTYLLRRMIRGSKHARSNATSSRGHLPASMTAKMHLTRERTRDSIATPVGRAPRFPEAAQAAREYH